MYFTVIFAYPTGSGACTADDLFITSVNVSDFVDPEERVSAASRLALREMGDANDEDDLSLAELADKYARLAVFEGTHDCLITNTADDSWLTAPAEPGTDEDSEPNPD